MTYLLFLSYHISKPIQSCQCLSDSVSNGGKGDIVERQCVEKTEHMWHFRQLFETTVSGEGPEVDGVTSYAIPKVCRGLKGEILPPGLKQQTKDAADQSHLVVNLAML